MKKISLILALLTALVIVGGLAGCSEYEAPPPPPPEIAVDFTKATPTAVNNAAVDGTTTATALGIALTGYGATVKFKVKLPDVASITSLSDYSTITFDLTSTDINNKVVIVLAAASLNASGLAGDNITTLSATGTQNLGNSFPNKQAFTLTIDKAKAASLNKSALPSGEFEMAVYMNHNAGSYKVENFKVK